MVTRGDGWWVRTKERFGRLWSGPPGRVRAAARRRHVQAMPASQYRAPVAPVERWSERRQLSHYSRPVQRGDHSPTTLVIVIVVITLGVALFYGVGWALNNAGAGSRATNGNGQAAASPTAVAKPAASPVASPAASTGGSPTTVLVPGGTGSPSPEAVPGARRTHRVVAGDTLAKIAQQYGTTVDAIMRANNITDRGRILRIGEELIIPAP